MKIAFRGSPRPTVGVEIELQLLDPETMNLVAGAPAILQRTADLSHVKAELIESTIELNTDVCEDIAAVRRDLTDRIAQLLAVTDELGYQVACAGTHPFSKWVEQRITASERYHRLVDQCQWPARRLMIFGVHVHVGIESGEKAIAISNGLTTYLPHLLALSASSPFFNAADTGLASCRTKIFESLPTAGLPYRLLNWAEFQRLMITLVNAKAIESIREIWWDVRPHPNFGTIEVRICDGLPTLDEVVAVTALIQALVVWLGDQYDEGMYLALHRHWIVRENKWRAARWATDAEIIVDEDGNLEPLEESLAALVESVSPVAKRLGSDAELQRIGSMLRAGPSYRRQRRIYEETHDYTAVMMALVREFRENAPVMA
jgi:carboxylate-amine ligase